MAIAIEVNEVRDPEVSQRLEAIIHGCLGNRPVEEGWMVSILDFGHAYQVTVKGPQPKREQVFFGAVQALPDKVRDWLESYPFR